MQPSLHVLEHDIRTDLERQWYRIHELRRKLPPSFVSQRKARVPEAVHHVFQRHDARLREILAAGRILPKFRSNFPLLEFASSLSESFASEESFASDVPHEESHKELHKESHKESHKELHEKSPIPISPPLSATSDVNESRETDFSLPKLPERSRSDAVSTRSLSRQSEAPSENSRISVLTQRVRESIENIDEALSCDDSATKTSIEAEATRRDETASPVAGRETSQNVPSLPSAPVSAETRQKCSTLLLVLLSFLAFLVCSVSGAVAMWHYHRIASPVFSQETPPPLQETPPSLQETPPVPVSNPWRPSPFTTHVAYVPTLMCAAFSDSFVSQVRALERLEREKRAVVLVDSDTQCAPFGAEWRLWRQELRRQWQLERDELDRRNARNATPTDENDETHNENDKTRNESNETRNQNNKTRDEASKAGASDDDKGEESEESDTKGHESSERNQREQGVTLIDETVPQVWLRLSPFFAVFTGAASFVLFGL
ncbi:MAG: hypothetical protein MHM6MM_004213 [Cercozoa sp. M6MM]